MTSLLPYKEEFFGILTDDQLYLDCVLVRPSMTPDDDLKVLRVWVPKYPLTKTSVITCARQEVKSYGPDGAIAHLVFDLRGTGDSDGTPGDHNFDQDLHAIEAWAEERFGYPGRGQKINFGFLGHPMSEYGTVHMWPLRAGSVIESYYYRAQGEALDPPTVLYLASYGNFSHHDDILCTQLAQAGYDVYGMDPLRYLLHASVEERLTPDDLYDDLRQFIQMLPNNPLVIGQPLAAGLGLFWAAGQEAVRGTVAIGRAQGGLKPAHIFNNSNPYTFLLARQVMYISPRPLMLVQYKGHPLGGEKDELLTLFKGSEEPHRLEKIRKVSRSFLLNSLQWLEANQPN